MLKTYLYIPEPLHQKIDQAAKMQNKSKAEVIRLALEKGIPHVTHQGNASAQSLLKLAAIGKKRNLRGPKDGSVKMDEYLWTKKWDKDE